MTDGAVIPLRRPRPEPDAPSDSALLAAVARGDRGALGALFDRYHRDVFRFAFHLARPGNDSEIDDVVQTTFLQAFRSAARFRGDAAVKTWLFGIAANVVRDQRKRAGRRRDALAALSEQPRAAPSGPRDQLERAEQARRLRAAIDALPHGQREAYVLCAIEQLSGKDAARALGIRTASLFRRLHDARRALRRALSADDDSPAMATTEGV